MNPQDFQQAPMNNMPNMGDTNFGNEMTNDSVDNEMDNMNNDMDSDELDPKKEIQQLTGKLSQALRNYNNDQNKPDTELNKYVAGMIISQASKSLTDSEKDAIIKKINSNDSDDTDDDNSMEGMDSMEDVGDDGSNDMVENVNSLIDNHKDRYDNKIRNKQISKKNPFVAER